MQLSCCPPCYLAYVAGSLGFAAEELTATRCMFHTKRAQALLLAGDAGTIAAYFQTRARIKDCPGPVATKTGMTWYRPISGSVDAVCCEACFEDHVKANAWATRFEPTHSDGARGCAFALPSIRDGYIKLAPDHWDGWRRLVARRTSVIPCTSSDVKASSRKWYTVTPAITSLVICEACYLDKVTASHFAAHFVPHKVTDRHSLYMCDFSSLYFLFPFAVADDTGAWGKFQTAASRVMDCAMAQMRYSGPEQFWGLGSGPDGRESAWDVCEKCYASLFEVYGFDRFLHPRPPSASQRTRRHCDMCPGAPRKSEMLARLQEAAYAGTFSHFSEWARRATASRHYGHGRLEYSPAEGRRGT
ncbi:hypothetical protein CspeluHIS016_0301280 [Cutaneotrichosporon spelunceum]|uniref:Uncharacterized protein n=1 Tax=Cutaneotrichosporon spelunceum TaxID=1672016 RepID=A0AAD3YBN5_9TREE|nr:hypothetical protein CspeluHIS016_0301280 [Cutaneotrichosporon spelunceum]